MDIWATISVFYSWNGFFYGLNIDVGELRYFGETMVPIEAIMKN